jgi:hypothetical protein
MGIVLASPQTLSCQGACVVKARLAQSGREYSAASGTAIAESCRGSCIQLLSLLLLPVLLLRLFLLQLAQLLPSLLQILIAVVIVVIVSIKLLMLDTDASHRASTWIMLRSTPHCLKFPET